MSGSLFSSFARGWRLATMSALLLDVKA